MHVAYELFELCYEPVIHGSVFTPDVPTHFTLNYCFQEQLGELEIFMVGCGALGCEFVKNFCTTGVRSSNTFMINIIGIASQGFVTRCSHMRNITSDRCGVSPVLTGVLCH